MENYKSFQDFFSMVAGELIGEGEFRKVFSCRLSPDLVVKIEREIDYREFPNLYEEKVWSLAKDNPKLRKWLAPVEFLSPDARALLMKRCDPLPGDFIMPDKLPHFLDDVKKSNFGLYQGKLVCFDYALTRFQLSPELTKVDWGRRDSGGLIRSRRKQ